MCGVYFGSQNSSVGFPAVPYYFYGSGDRNPEPSRQARPDILLEDQNCLAIVDSKYYDLRATKPPWSDLVKQFFYAKAFAHRSKYRSIKNALRCLRRRGNFPPPPR